MTRSENVIFSSNMTEKTYIGQQTAAENVRSMGDARHINKFIGNQITKGPYNGYAVL